MAGPDPWCEAERRWTRTIVRASTNLFAQIPRPNHHISARLRGRPLLQLRIMAGAPRFQYTAGHHAAELDIRDRSRVQMRLRSRANLDFVESARGRSGFGSRPHSVPDLESQGSPRSTKT